MESVLRNIRLIFLLAEAKDSKKFMSSARPKMGETTMTRTIITAIAALTLLYLSTSEGGAYSCEEICAKAKKQDLTHEYERRAYSWCFEGGICKKGAFVSFIRPVSKGASGILITMITTSKEGEKKRFYFRMVPEKM